jgi:hypothetical protein
MIAFPFLSAGGAGGDYAGDSGTVGVSDDDHQQTVDESGGVFSVLGSMSSVCDRKPPGICKHQSRFRKADTVLARFLAALSASHSKFIFENVCSFSYEASVHSYSAGGSETCARNPRPSGKSSPQYKNTRPGPNGAKLGRTEIGGRGYFRNTSR